MEENQKRVAIIGSGPAGLTAAIYLGRANLKPTLFAGSIFGGQLMITTEVDNFPGFPEGINGPELMIRMIDQAKKFGSTLIYKDVDKVDFSKRPYTLYTGSDAHEFDAILIATGASSKTLQLDSEKRLIGRGVSYCATCDGAFFKDRDIAVIGGGDSAMEEALFLTKFAKKVYIIHRKDTFRASKIMQDKVLSHPKIEVLFNSEVFEVLGETAVTGLTLTHTQTQEKSDVTLQGVFVAIGHNPNTAIFKDQIELNDLGYVRLFENSKTNKEGIFTAGDVDDFRYRQAITAAGEGCKAALDLEKYIEGV